MVVRDPTGAVLLTHAPDPGCWFTPGGGVHDGETVRNAAIRELAEETGITVTLPGTPVLHRRAHLTFLDEPIEQVETFWVAMLGHRPPVASQHLEDYEAHLLDAWRWWTPAELATTDEVVYPTCLAELVTHLDSGRLELPWVEEHLSPPARVWHPQHRGQLPAWAVRP